MDKTTNNGLRNNIHKYRLRNTQRKAEEWMKIVRKWFSTICIIPCFSLCNLSILLNKCIDIRFFWCVCLFFPVLHLWFPCLSVSSVLSIFCPVLLLFYHWSSSVLILFLPSSTFDLPLHIIFIYFLCLLRFLHGFP